LVLPIFGLDSQHFSDHQNVLIAIWNVKNRKLKANDGNQQNPYYVQQIVSTQFCEAA
jgi:hypothetical protein